MEIVYISFKNSVPILMYKGQYRKKSFQSTLGSPDPLIVKLKGVTY